MANCRNRNVSSSASNSNPKADEQQGPESKVFSTREDMDHFQLIFHAVKHSELVSQSQVPVNIIQEIAEFGNGFVFDCAAKRCNEKVIVLHGDMSSENDSICGKQVSYRWAPKAVIASRFVFMRFYCCSCALQTEWCHQCQIWSFLPDCTKCSGCTGAIHYCICRKAQAFDCCVCHSGFCRECFGEDTICEEFICSKCLMDPTNRNVSAL